MEFNAHEITIDKKKGEWLGKEVGTEEVNSWNASNRLEKKDSPQKQTERVKIANKSMVAEAAEKFSNHNPDEGMNVTKKGKG